MGDPRFQTSEVLAWSSKIAGLGAAITLDVPIQKTGLISQPYLDELRRSGPPVPITGCELKLRAGSNMIR